MASLAGGGTDSSLSKVVAIVESSWSGDRDRIEGLKSGGSLREGCKGLENLVGIG